MTERTPRSLRAVPDPSSGRFVLTCDECGTSELLGERERPHDGAMRHIAEEHNSSGVSRDVAS